MLAARATVVCLLLAASANLVRSDREASQNNSPRFPCAQPLSCSVTILVLLLPVSGVIAILFANWLENFQV